MRFINWLTETLAEHNVPNNFPLQRHIRDGQTMATTVCEVAEYLHHAVRYSIHHWEDGIYGPYHNEADLYDDHYDMFDTLTEECESIFFVNPVQFLSQVIEAVGYAGFINDYLTIVRTDLEAVAP